MANICCCNEWQAEQVLYRCALSWAWGLVSDTDIEADDWRHVG